ncbi:GNAT family N-acetyltransferase [Microbacterium sp. NPDC058062]|uniref:GNAT family N-acetyltransferase n=1 Tax=Microbacterium sp. NPDC058062 TaxID=3346320 RepID=UPI0036D7712C
METGPKVHVRDADLAGVDAMVVGRLVKEYLLQTEHEKAQRFATGFSGSHLPRRYVEEVEDPARAYENARVALAELAGSSVGVVVVQQSQDGLEVKRLWVDPRARGNRVGSALLDAACGGVNTLPVRLTVWDWREEAIGLYLSRGFVAVPTWDERPRLVCMEKPPSP